MRLCSEHAVVLNPWQLWLWSTSFLWQVSLSLTLAACLAPEMTDSLLCKAPLPRKKLNHYHPDPAPLLASNPRGCGEEHWVGGNDSYLVVPKAAMENSPGEKALNSHPCNPSTETQELLLAQVYEGIYLLLLSLNNFLLLTLSLSAKWDFYYPQRLLSRYQWSPMHIYRD